MKSPLILWALSLLVPLALIAIGRLFGVFSVRATYGFLGLFFFAQFCYIGFRIHFNDDDL